MNKRIRSKFLINFIFPYSSKFVQLNTFSLFYPEIFYHRPSVNSHDNVNRDNNIQNVSKTKKNRSDFTFHQRDSNTQAYNINNIN